VIFVRGGVVMKKEKLIEEKQGSCSCPFCDMPICPDPDSGKYNCPGEDKLTIYRVDCVGLYCPLPVMQAKEEIDRLEKGNLMELVADDPASLEDIPRWARRAGHKLITTRQKDGEYHFLIQKDEGEVE
jgi:tRNA 2-thiouridine synthesizing protein A